MQAAITPDEQLAAQTKLALRRLKPAVGYRIEFNGRSVLISGDTRLNQNVIKYGAGVDLLLHEVLAVNPAVLQKVPKLMAIFDLHTSPAQCGEVLPRPSRSSQLSPTLC